MEHDDAPLTDQANQAIATAFAEAARLNDAHIGTEHILLGVIAQNEGPAVKALLRLGVRLEDLQRALLFTMGHGRALAMPVDAGQITFDPGGRAVLRLALDEANRQGLNQVGTEHLLLGLLCEGEGIAAGVLASLGVTQDRAREALLALGPEADARERVEPSGSNAPVGRVDDDTTSGLDRFSEPARRVLALAQAEAIGLNDAEVGSEHLLLGLMGVSSALREFVQRVGGIDLDRVRDRIATNVETHRWDTPRLGALPSAGQPPPKVDVAADLRRVIERAVATAANQPAKLVAPEHLAYGLIATANSRGLRLLREFGLNPDIVPALVATPTEALSAGTVLRSYPIYTATQRETSRPHQRAMSARFADGAQRALHAADVEARRLNHGYIGTEHLLLGLLAQGDPLAAAELQEQGVDYAKARAVVEIAVGRGDQWVSGDIGLSPRAKVVIELGVDEAHSLGHQTLEPAHILMGLIREGEGIAIGVLESLGVNLEQTRLATRRRLTQHLAATAAASPDVAPQSSLLGRLIRVDPIGVSREFQSVSIDVLSLERFEHGLTLQLRLTPVDAVSSFIGPVALVEVTPTGLGRRLLPENAHTTWLRRPTGDAWVTLVFTEPLDPATVSLRLRLPDVWATVDAERSASVYVEFVVPSLATDG